MKNNFNYFLLAILTNCFFIVFNANAYQIDIAEKYNIFKKVSTRYELPDGTKQYGKSIMNDPEKYFTEDIMKQIEEAVGKEFKYG